MHTVNFWEESKAIKKICLLAKTPLRVVSSVTSKTHFKTSYFVMNSDFKQLLYVSHKDKNFLFLFFWGMCNLGLRKYHEYSLFKSVFLTSIFQWLRVSGLSRGDREQHRCRL